MRKNVTDKKVTDRRTAAKATRRGRHTTENYEFFCFSPAASVRNLVGRIQQLNINNQNIIEQAHMQQIEYQGEIGSWTDGRMEI